LNICDYRKTEKPEEANSALTKNMVNIILQKGSVPAWVWFNCLGTT